MQLPQTNTDSQAGTEKPLAITPTEQPPPKETTPASQVPTSEPRLNPDPEMSTGLQPAVYILQNVMSGSILDLSGGDNKSLIGFTRHGGENQQWECYRLGEGWYIRSVHTGTYLSIEDGLGEGHSIIANNYPVSWVIEPDYDAGLDIYRISWPGTSFNIELDKGDDTPGTKVKLGIRDPSREQQLWRFILYQVSSQQVTHTNETTSGNTTTTTTTMTVTTTTITTTTAVRRDDE